MIFQSVVVYLKDGRTVDISGRTPEDAVAHLRSLGVKSPDDIAKTVHAIAAEPERPGR